VSKILCFVLSNGEHLVAQCSQGDTGFHLQRPHMLFKAQLDARTVATKAQPWLVGNEGGSITIRSEHVIGVYEPDESVKKGYLQASSGVAIADASLAMRMGLT
jgi:hypothetical protein